MFFALRTANPQLVADKPLFYVSALLIDWPMPCQKLWVSEMYAVVNFTCTRASSVCAFILSVVYPGDSPTCVLLQMIAMSSTSKSVENTLLAHDIGLSAASNILAEREFPSRGNCSYSRHFVHINPHFSSANYPPPRNSCFWSLKYQLLRTFP